MKIIQVYKDSLETDYSAARRSGKVYITSDPSLQAMNIKTQDYLDQIVSSSKVLYTDSLEDRRAPVKTGGSLEHVNFIPTEEEQHVDEECFTFHNTARNVATDRNAYVDLEKVKERLN